MYVEHENDSRGILGHLHFWQSTTADRLGCHWNGFSVPGGKPDAASWIILDLFQCLQQ